MAEVGTVLRSPWRGLDQQKLCGDNIAAITLQTHHLVRKERKDEYRCLQREFGSSDSADAGSLWIFLVGSSVQSESSPYSA